MITFWLIEIIVLNPVGNAGIQGLLTQGPDQEVVRGILYSLQLVG
jgi:hypothetical protein